MTIPPVGPMEVAALIGCLIASWTDVRTGKILNALTFPLMLVGLLYWSAAGVVLKPLLGIGIAFAIHFPLWIGGIQKGGDAKLIMGLGALLGTRLMVELTIWYAILYVPAGLIILAMSGKLGNFIAALKYTAAKAQGQEVGDPPEPTMLRTAPVISAATGMAWLTPWLDGVITG